MKKNAVFTLLIFVCSLFISGLFVELLMRIFYKPVPAFDLTEIKDSFDIYEYTPPLNVLGFREDELTKNVFQRSTKRILFLGDSFTFGNGVENGSDRFSDIIEGKLNEELKPNNANYHIYNAGVTGTEPRRWRQYLKALLPIYKPQSVVVIFFLRDGTDLCTSLMCYKKKIVALNKKLENNFVYNYSYLGNYIGNRLAQKSFADYYMNRMINSYLGNQDERQTWFEQQSYLLAMQKLCADNKIDFHLVIFPMLFGLEGNYQFHDVEAEINHFANQNQIPIFSLTPGFIGIESKSLWVSPSDQHPNEKGHKIAAEILYPYIEQSVIQ